MQTDAFDCRELGGYFLAGVGPCTEFVCATGACCKQDAECVDDDGGGGPMDEELCDIMGGNYLGGAHCDIDPCQRFRIPQGYEIIEVTPGMENLQRRGPRLNNCGEIVVHIGTETSSWDAEIYLYDNGPLTQLTENDVGDTFPDINDERTIVWMRGFDGSYGGEVLMLRGVETTVLGPGQGPRINNANHVGWQVPIPEACDLTEFRSAIFCYDGSTVASVFDDGLSNQGGTINDHDQMVWTRYEFPCGGGIEDWTSQVMLYTEGLASTLPSNADPPQIGGEDIDNRRRVAWSSPLGIEVWEDGVTTLFTEWRAAAPALSDRGDVAFRFRESDEPWQIWLYRDGQFYRISNDLDIENLIDNHSADINEAGEIAWKWVPNGGLSPAGTRFMRRIRNGDVDFDGDRDLDDFIPMPNCWTGPVPTDRLCECRFFDIDHDRDIDYDDFDLFMRVYTGPLDDCNQNEIIDLYDLIDGPSQDCNLNGIPDECDIESGFSQDIDGDGVPDECIAPIPAVSEWGLVALTLLLLLAGSILLTRRRPARA